MDIFLYCIYIGIFFITLHYLSFNNNRLYFLFKAILLASFIITLVFVVYIFIENQSDIQHERIRLVFDRVVSSEIMLSLISFSLVFSMISCKNENLKIKYTILSICVITLQTFLLMYLKTRTSWIAFIIILMLFMYFIFSSHKREVNYKRLFLSLIIAICFSGIIYWVVPHNNEQERSGLKDTFLSMIDEDYYTSKSRISFWNASLKMFKENPLTGIGHGNWQGLYPKYDEHSYTDATIGMNSAVNPHNEYLEILAEYGIFGLVIFTGFIFTGIYLLFKNVKKEILIMPFLLMAVGITIAMFFSFPSENVWAFSLFIISLAVGYSDLYNRLKKNFSVLRYSIIIGLALFILGVWFGINKYTNEKTYLEAMQLKANGQYTRMLEKLNEVSDTYYKIDMNKMPVDFYRGVGYFELGYYEKALESFKNSRELMKYYPVIMNNEAGAFYMLGNTKKAEEQYLEIRSLFPDYIEPQINLLSLYTNEGRKDDAFNLLKELENKELNTKDIKNYSVFLKIKDYLKSNNQY
ncbi:MAG: O-antigen ligase family protein [Ignavibacteria bacterium]